MSHVKGFGSETTTQYGFLCGVFGIPTMDSTKK